MKSEEPTTSLLKGRLPSPHQGDLARQVYAELREAICEGRVPPHERLVQNALAEDLGISRTPVRDALLQLAQEGLVQPAPSRGGFLVTEFTPHEVLEIYDVRIALEPMAAAAAAGKHSHTQLGEMRDINEKIRAGGGIAREQYQLNERFHGLVVEECGNRILIKMLSTLWGMPSSQRMYYLQFKEGSDSNAIADGHNEIIAALEDGDAKRVEKRVHDHIAAARQAALEHFERQGV